MSSSVENSFGEWLIPPTLGMKIAMAMVPSAHAAIGADSWLMPQVAIGADCMVGARVRLHSGVVLGSDGFGYEFVAGHIEGIGTILNCSLFSPMFVFQEQAAVIEAAEGIQDRLAKDNLKLVIDVSPDIGGGFGNKVPIYPGYVCAIVASIGACGA